MKQLSQQPVTQNSTSDSTVSYKVKKKDIPLKNISIATILQATHSLARKSRDDKVWGQGHGQRKPIEVVISI